MATRRPFASSHSNRPSRTRRALSFVIAADETPQWNDGAGGAIGGCFGRRRRVLYLFPGTCNRTYSSLLVLRRKGNTVFRILHGRGWSIIAVCTVLSAVLAASGGPVAASSASAPAAQD